MTHKNEFIPRSILCLREGYTKKIVLGDLFAGLTVGIVALPLAMALAIASGLTPERGLITAVIAGFLISALGGSRVQIGGPTGAFVIIVSGIVARHGYDGLVLATFMAGFVLLALGLARLGTMIKYIPYPVTTGFTSGIAVIIFSTQVKDFFGLSIESVPSDFVPKWIVYLTSFDAINPAAFAIGALSLAMLLAIRKFDPRIPAALVTVVVASALVKIFGMPVETIGSRFGEIPSHISLPHLPSFDFAQMRALIPEALTIALLAGIESLLSAVVADGMTGDRHSSNGELVAQGIANISSVLFGGIPATGAIARTATNIRSGAKTPLAGMIHAAVLLGFMLLLTPLASLIPLASLAAILFLVAWNMSEIDHFRYLLRAPRGDVAVLLSTFLLTILVDLTVAVEVGVVMAALLFMKRMSDVTDAVTTVDMFQSDEGDALRRPEQIDVPAGAEIFEVNGPFFFGMADRFKDMLNRVKAPPKAFVLRLRKVPVIDATALHCLREFYHKCARQNATLVLTEVQPTVMRALKTYGLLDIIGETHVHATLDAALQDARIVVASR